MHLNNVATSRVGGEERGGQYARRAPGGTKRHKIYFITLVFGGANACQVCSNVFLVAFYGQCECSFARSARHKRVKDGKRGEG